MNELARVLSMVGLVLLVAAPEGCVGKMGQSSMSASSGKRKITATMDGAASISMRNKTCQITFGRHRLVLESSRVVLDGTELAKIASDASKFHVDYTGGVLSVTADDKEIVSLPVPR